MDNFEWPDMPVEKIPQSNLNFNDDYGKSHLSSENIYDYLKLCHKHGSHKLAGIITNKQRIFNIARGSDHWTLEREIFKKIFPKRNYSWNNPYDDGVQIFAVGSSEFVINLPAKLSKIQYESVLKIIDQIHQFEKDFDTTVKYFNADYILEEAKKKLSQIKPYDSDEVIVGIPLTEELLEEEKMNETRNYQSMTHGEWDKMFDTMNKEQIQQMLMDKNVIDALINENVSSNYPSINSLLGKARELGVTDSSYYVLFTNGYVAEALDKRLTQQQAYGRWDYEEKKFELLTNLPEGVKWILGIEPYITVLSKVSKNTAQSITDLSSTDTLESMSKGISKKLEEAKETVEKKRFALAKKDEYLSRLRAQGLNRDEMYIEQRRERDVQRRNLEDAQMELNKLESVSKYMETSLERQKGNGQSVATPDIAGMPEPDVVEELNKGQFNPETTTEIEYSAERAAIEAKQALAQIAQQEFENSHENDMSFEERNNGMIAIAQQFLKLSDEAALSIAKFADRKKLEQERQNANEGLRYDTPPYRREHYVELFKYLDSQLEKTQPVIREFVEASIEPSRTQENEVITKASDWNQNFSRSIR